MNRMGMLILRDGCYYHGTENWGKQYVAGETLGCCGCALGRSCTDPLPKCQCRCHDVHRFVIEGISFP